MYASIAFPTSYFYSEYIKTSPVSIIVKKNLFEVYKTLIKEEV